MTVVVSPHFDDAVLSCFHALRPGALVLTIFTGSPAGGEPSRWDRMCHFKSSARAMAVRYLEDVMAIAPTGASRQCAGLLEHSYSPDARPSEGRIREIIDVAVAEWGLPILVPVAGGATPHPDHVLIREAVLGLAGVSFYADYPYCAKQGWNWGAAWWPDVQARLTEDGRGLDVQAHTPDKRAKWTAISEYRTQLRPLDRYRGQVGCITDAKRRGAGGHGWELEYTLEPW